MFDERQLVMRIGAGVAVTGKMLAARGDPFRLQRRMIAATQPGDVLGTLGERAVADDRILRIGEDVENGREVERNADGAELRRQRAREAFGERSSPLRPSVSIGGQTVNGDLSRATRPPS